MEDIGFIQLHKENKCLWIVCKKKKKEKKFWATNVITYILYLHTHNRLYIYIYI